MTWDVIYNIRDHVDQQTVDLITKIMNINKKLNTKILHLNFISESRGKKEML